MSGSWDEAVDERLDFLESRLNAISGVIREELVRRVVKAVRKELVKVAVGVVHRFPHNSDRNDAATAVWRALNEADLSHVVPALSDLVKVEAGSPGDLVKQLADARAEIARLKGGAS